MVTIDLPGINKENTEINLKEDMLEISAKTGKEKETEEEGYIHKEREYTGFFRAVCLPTNVEEEGSTAKIENGVLTITLPKMKMEEPAENINRIIFKNRLILFDAKGPLFRRGNENII